MLGDATIVEILLAVLALMIGIGSFVGAGRANRTPPIAPVPTQSEMDDIAADRAMKFYEASIKQLTDQIARLNERQDFSDKEINRLTRENQLQGKELMECKAYGRRLEARLAKYEGEQANE